MEEWKKYKEYQISSWGNVKGKFGRLMKPAKTTRGYLQVNIYEEGVVKKMLVHRLVALCFLDNPDNKEFVDHIDGNILNNKVENIRWATKSQNCMNRVKASNNTSGYKGVCWNKQHQKWMAMIHLNGNNKYLGLYNTAEEASTAYVKASRELFKDFSRV